MRTGRWKLFLVEVRRRHGRQVNGLDATTPDKDGLMSATVGEVVNGRAGRLSDVGFL